MERMFCENCGASLNKGDRFCLDCGEQIKRQINPSQNEKNVNETENPELSKERSRNTKNNLLLSRKKMSKSKKIILTLVISLFILMIGAHIVILNLTDSNKKLQAIHNAIVNENGEDLSKEFILEESVIYDEENFVKSLKENGAEKLLENLRSSIQTTLETGLNSIVLNDDGIELFHVSKEKFLWLYPVVDIKPLTSSITVYAEISDAQLEIANEVFEVDGKEFIIEKVVPSDYTLKFSGENEYFKSAVDYSIDSQAFKEPVRVNLTKAKYSLSFRDIPNNTTLYIDNKKVDKPIKEIDGLTPVFSSDLSLHAVRKLDDNKTEESEVIKGIQAGVVTFTFPLLEKANKEVEQETRKKEQDAKYYEEKMGPASVTYSEFRKAYEMALNYQDFSYVADFLYGTGSAYDELSEFINNPQEDYYAYHFITNEVKSGEVIDKGLILDVFEVFNYENAYGDTIKYEREKKYTLIEVSPGHFQITNISIVDTNKY